MSIRWIVAAAGCLGLALLTLNAAPDLHFDRRRRVGRRAADLGLPRGRQAGEPELHPQRRRRQGRQARRRSRARSCCSISGRPGAAPARSRFPGSSSSRTSTARTDCRWSASPSTTRRRSSSPTSQQMKMNYPVLQGLDHDDMQDAYGPMFGIPVTIVISRDGKMCAKHVGLSSKDALRERRSSRCCSGMIGAMLKGFTHARLACGCRVAFREGVEGSPGHRRHRREVARLHAAAARARPADVRLSRSAASVDAPRPAGRRRVRRRGLSAASFARRRFVLPPASPDIAQIPFG